MFSVFERICFEDQKPHNLCDRVSECVYVWETPANEELVLAKFYQLFAFLSVQITDDLEETFSSSYFSRGDAGLAELLFIA